MLFLCSSKTHSTHPCAQWSTVGSRESGGWSSLAGPAPSGVALSQNSLGRAPPPPLSRVWAGVVGVSGASVDFVRHQVWIGSPPRQVCPLSQCGQDDSPRESRAGASRQTSCTAGTGCGPRRAGAAADAIAPPGLHTDARVEGCSGGEAAAKGWIECRDSSRPRAGIARGVLDRGSHHSDLLAR